MGLTSNATGELVAIGSSSDQILLINIEGTFTTGEQISDGNATTTLSDAGNPANAVAKIDGAWTGADTTAVSINGWTTGPNNYIRVYTTESARHDGKWDEGKYRMSQSNPGDGLIRIMENNIVIDGLQIKFTAGGGVQNGISVNFGEGALEVSAQIEIKNNIIYDYAPIYTEAGIRIPAYGYDYLSLNSGSYINIYNNVFYDFSSNYLGSPAFAINIRGGSGRIYIFNNTISNSNIGISEDSRNSGE